MRFSQIASLALIFAAANLSQTSEPAPQRLGISNDWKGGGISPFHMLPINIHPETGIKISYAGLSRVALGHADILFCGDTNHYNPYIQGLFYSSDALDVYKESGVQKIMIEADSAAAEHIQSMADRSAMTTMFIRFFQKEMGLIDSVDDVSGEGGLVGARIRGMDIVGVDVQTEDEKMALLQDTVRARQNISFFNRLGLDTAVYTKIQKTLSPGEKSVLIYGAAHGSAYGDRFLEDQTLSLLKVEVYQSIQGYLQRLESDDLLLESFEKNTGQKNLTVGMDLPHMIYFMDTGMVFFSERASPEFIRAVKAAADIENAPKPQNTHQNPAPTPI